MRVEVLREAMLGAAPPSQPRGAPPAPFDRMGDARHDAAALPEEVVTQPRPEEYLSPAVLPPAWDWRSVIVAPTAPPVHFVTRVRNQFLPLWCGSCWAHAATAVLGSRWLIHANATWPPEGQAGIGELICEPEPSSPPSQPRGAALVPFDRMGEAERDPTFLSVFF